MADDREPPRFPELWLRFRELHIDEGLPNSAVNLGWLPPECPARFTPTPAEWHIWRAGTRGQDNTLIAAGGGQEGLPSRVRIYGSTSIFYSTELHSYLEVPYDVTEEHVSDHRQQYDEDGWNRISFMNSFRSPQQPNLWMIGHAHPKKQIDTNFWLSDSWEELLLPGSFANGPWHKNRQPTCDLGGSLPIIFGLIAFTTGRNDLIGMVRESFRPMGNSYYVPTWQTNRRRDQGRIPKRGLVVDVAFDTTRVTPDQIKAWEDGIYGPILTSNENYNRSSSSANTSARHGTGQQGPTPGHRPLQPAMRYGPSRRM